MRYAIEIAYKGTHYHGWQSQPNAITVQESIENALQKMMRTRLEIVGSGRTDTGVHAEQQFAHFDTDIEIDRSQWLYHINKILPHDIVIKNITPVNAQWHARYDALWRSYEYRISRSKNPFLEGLVYDDSRFYDEILMQEAAQMLLQYEDFQSFSKVNTDVQHFKCQLKQATWHYSPHLWVFEITANRFLRGMVRAIVGTLLEVGKGKMNIKTLETAILQKDRRLVGAAAPPQGLFLSKVIYPDFPK